MYILAKMYTSTTTSKPVDTMAMPKMPQENVYLGQVERLCFMEINVYLGYAVPFCSTPRTEEPLPLYSSLLDGQPCTTATSCILSARKSRSVVLVTKQDADEMGVQKTMLL